MGRSSGEENAGKTAANNAANNDAKAGYQPPPPNRRKTKLIERKLQSLRKSTGREPVDKTDGEKTTVAEGKYR